MKITRIPLTQADRDREARVANGHRFFVPPGSAYAAACANRAREVREVRERAIFDDAFCRGAEAGRAVAEALA